MIRHQILMSIPKGPLKHFFVINKPYIASKIVIKMSRCEHGQPITLFCLSQTCNWRESGGCDNCMKKYHTHVQNIDTITIEKLQNYTKMFHLSPDVKSKCKTLQQAVCNYFIVMKSQISTSLDAVSRSITNKLTFPYLYSEGQLSTFRKIRTKEYKKITKKELKNFCNFMNTQNQQLIEFNERKLYTNEVQELSSIIKSINQSFLMYSKAVEKIDNSFNIQRSFYNKILQISSSIDGKDKKIDLGPQKTSKSSLTKESNPEGSGKVLTKAPSRDRKVSIDNGMGIQLNRFKNASENNPNFDQNEKQIYERKKKLFQMMNNPNPQQNVDKKATEPQTLKENEAKREQFETTESKELQGQDQKSGTAQKRLTTQEDQVQERKQGLFEDLMSKGINLPEMILHTILPRQASKQKLYQDTRDVKERKITIPVKQYEQKEENQSPLLKRKRQKKKEEKQNQEEAKRDQNEMKKITFFGQRDQNDYVVEETFQTPKKQKESEKDDENTMLKDREADSLALLLQSLPLPAQKAIPLLEAALKFAHNNLSAAEYLSYLYLDIQKPKQCLELCNKVLEQIQESPQANQLAIHISNNKAAALNMLGRYSESIGILEKCLAYTKRDIYYKNLGDAYFSIAIYQKASINYENALKMNNHMEEAFYNLAVCYYLQEHLHEAKLNVQNALKLNPRNEDYLQLSRQIMLKLPS